MSLAACVSASLLKDFLWPDVELPDTCETFDHFKSVMTPGPRHDPELRELRALPYTSNTQGVRFDESNLSGLWVDKLRPNDTIHLGIIERVDDELMRDLGFEWNVNMRPDDRNSQANWLSHKLSGICVYLYSLLT